MPGSYDKFADFLGRQKSPEIQIGFSEIEKICGRKMSDSAYVYPGWWSNHPSHPLMKRVLAASWFQYDLDLTSQTVWFRRGDASQKGKTSSAQKQDKTRKPGTQTVMGIKTSYDKIFENECDEITTGMDARDTVSVNTVISLAIRLSNKYPVLFLPAFIEDFVRGMPSTHMIQKYVMLNFNNFASSMGTLKLKSRQYKDPNMGVKDKNLRDSDQRKQYQFLSKYANMLYGPLENLLNHNILQALVSYSLLTHTYIASENLQDHAINAYNTTCKEIAVLADKERADSFERYMRDELRMKINDIVLDLHEQGYVVVRDGDTSVTLEYPKSVEHVYDMLKGEKSGTSHASFQRTVFERFPLFRLASPCVQIFDNIINTMESKNLLVRKRPFWKSSFSNDQLFTTENYESMMSDMKRQRIASGRTKFFGRRIGPELFLDELKSLEYGDLDDDDDQVTRIAGLVLSDAAMLQSPRENMAEFDFVVDLENYDFRPEQEEIMKKLDFRVDSTVFHCKVMINETVTQSVLSRLAGALPAGEQGVIFTCMPVDGAVSDIIASDKTVQIINEDALREWCTITPTAPCRKNSVARVMYGDNRGKVILVKSINYESGLATAEIVPGNQEILVPIGSIEEMLPNVSSLDDFEAASASYLDFLHLLASAAQDSFEEGMNTEIIAVYDDSLDLLKNTSPELFDDGNPGSHHSTGLPYKSSPRSGTKYVQFENVHARIRTSSSLDYCECTCNHLLNEGSYKTLCTHLVAGIDHLCRDPGDVKTILKNTDVFKTALRRFRFRSIERSLDALGFALGPKSQILESYLKHVSPDQ